MRAPAHEPIHIRIRVWRGHFEFDVNDGLVPSNDMDSFALEGRVSSGSMRGFKPRSTERFSNIAIRKLERRLR